MTRVFTIVAMALVMMATSTPMLGADHMEPQLYSSMTGPKHPCPHYAGGCRSRVTSWLTHLDESENLQEPMRVALYNYGYRNARKECIAAYRAAAKVSMDNGDADADIAKAGIGAFLDAAEQHKEAM